MPYPFPTRFIPLLSNLLGKADPSNPVRNKRISLKEASSHLLNYATMHPVGKELYYPFMEHDRFVFYANDRDRRHRVPLQPSPLRA
jgi:hypothetical protein